VSPAGGCSSCAGRGVKEQDKDAEKAEAQRGAEEAQGNSAETQRDAEEISVFSVEFLCFLCFLLNWWVRAPRGKAKTQREQRKFLSF